MGTVNPTPGEARREPTKKEEGKRTHLDFLSLSHCKKELLGVHRYTALQGKGAKCAFLGPLLTQGFRVQTKKLEKGKSRLSGTFSREGNDPKQREREKVSKDLRLELLLCFSPQRLAFLLSRSGDPPPPLQRFAPREAACLLLKAARGRSRGCSGTLPIRKAPSAPSLVPLLEFLETWPVSKT